MKSKNKNQFRANILIVSNILLQRSYEILSLCTTLATITDAIVAPFFVFFCRATEVNLVYFLPHQIKALVRII